MPHRPKKSKIERTYIFFVKVEQGQHTVTIDQIISATGYTTGTARTYILNKWRRFLIPTTTGCYEVKGVQTQTLQEFAALLQKKSLPSPPQKLVLHLPPALAEWLYTQAVQQNCTMHDVAIDVLEHHRQAQ